MKLALNAWYEAWSRAGGEEVGAASFGDAVGVAEAATAREGTGTEHRARHGMETLEATGPPFSSGL